MSRLVVKEAKLWQPGDALQPQVSALSSVAARHGPQVFFTLADVTLLRSPETPVFLRGGDMQSAPTAAGSVTSSLYVCLALRVMKCPSDLVAFVELCERTIASLGRSKSDLVLDLSNASLVLKEMGLLQKAKKAK